MAKKSNNFDNFIQSLIDPNSLSSKTSKNKTKKRKKNPVVEECVKTENSKNTEESILQELENIEESASKSFEFFSNSKVKKTSKNADIDESRPGRLGLGSEKLLNSSKYKELMQFRKSILQTKEIKESISQKQKLKPSESLSENKGSLVKLKGTTEFLPNNKRKKKEKEKLLKQTTKIKKRAAEELNSKTPDFQTTPPLNPQKQTPSSKKQRQKTRSKQKNIKKDKRTPLQIQEALKKQKN
jgi:hypothetical protein